jgi:large subunit ribosomal protein L31
MKKDIHPAARYVIFQDTVNGAQFRALSTMKSEATTKVDGTDYPLVKIDVSSASHPFYTGQQRILDTAGRVEKFGKRYGDKLGALKGLAKKPAK